MKTQLTYLSTYLPLCVAMVSRFPQLAIKVRKVGKQWVVFFFFLYTRWR